MVVDKQQSLQIQVDYERLTPSLREEIAHAIIVHEEALKQPSLDVPFVEELDSLQDQIEAHWSRVYKSCIDHSHLVADLGQYQLFLTHLLLSEYTAVAFTDTRSIGWLHQSATHIKRAGTDTTSEFREIFYESIVLPLDELLLNRPHVELRLLLAAGDDDQKRPLGGLIQSLIKWGNWKDLAKYLYNDRELALCLFKYQPILPGLFDSDTRDNVLQGIASIQQKYFTNISSPTEYTTSKYAMSLETVKQTPDSSYGFAAAPAVENEKPLKNDLSSRNRGKSIFSAIAGGIKSLSTRSGHPQAAGQQVSVTAIRDDRAPLLEEKKP